MKESRYNYYVDFDDTYDIIFNGLTKRFFKVSKGNSLKFREMISNPNAYEDEYRAFILRMLNEGFIIDDYTDEISLVERMYNNACHSDTGMMLIYPTYQCNVRCWYCIQNHNSMRMDDNTIFRLKRHIEKYIRSNKIKNFYISWFGGEPLLEYETICEVTSFAKKICETSNILFSAGMTTNGILLSDERIKAFRQQGITHFQITIDGHREQHNQVKKIVGKSTFDITLNNVKSIVEIMPEASVNLRVNYTADCVPEHIMKDINGIIPHHLRNNITIVPCKVWQIAQHEIQQITLNNIRSMGRDAYKFNGCTMGICYVERKNFETIYPNGMVGKCDNDDVEDARGTLSEDGEIIWHDIYEFDKYTVFSKESTCRACKHLPVCWGPCPRKREDIIKQQGNYSCIQTDAEGTVKEYILNYISSFKNV